MLSGYLNVSAAPNPSLSPDLSKSSLHRSLSLRMTDEGDEGDEASPIHLAMQFWVASILTCPRWEISTTTLSPSTGRGCFQGSPSILMYVWSGAPLWNSNWIRCAYMSLENILNLGICFHGWFKGLVMKKIWTLISYFYIITSFYPSISLCAFSSGLIM